MLFCQQYMLYAGANTTFFIVGRAYFFGKPALHCMVGPYSDAIDAGKQLAIDFDATAAQAAPCNNALVCTPLTLRVCRQCAKVTLPTATDELSRVTTTATGGYAEVRQCAEAAFLCSACVSMCARTPIAIPICARMCAPVYIFTCLHCSLHVQGFNGNNHPAAAANQNAPSAATDEKLPLPATSAGAEQDRAATSCFGGVFWFATAAERALITVAMLLSLGTSLQFVLLNEITGEALEALMQ